MRYAVYFTPPPDAPLTRLAAWWLGRDAFGGEAVPMRPAGSLGTSEIRAATAEPRRYGFHATLKAPFRLAPGQSEESLIAALEAFCAVRSSLELPPLVVRQLDRFFALVPAKPCPPLDRLAADAVTEFEPFRAPLSEMEMARRRPEQLSDTQRDNLLRWGYPYVFDEFRFHMTLTGPVEEADAAGLRQVLEGLFAPVLKMPFGLDGLALFAEPEPGADFSVRAYRRLAR